MITGRSTTGHILTVDVNYAFLAKLMNSSSSIERISSTSIISGAKSKCYTCNMCERTFAKQGQLKRNKKTEHREKTENGRKSGILSKRGSVIV